MSGNVLVLCKVSTTSQDRRNLKETVSLEFTRATVLHWEIKAKEVYCHPKYSYVDIYSYKSNEIELRLKIPKLEKN